MLIKAGDDLDALWAVMNLVQPAPETIDFVTPAVPPVVDEGDHQVTDDGSPSHAEAVRRPGAVPHHPAVPGNAGDKHHADLDAVENGGPHPPPGDARPGSPWSADLPRDHDHGYSKDR